jgi:opacity protein-like surface antigen
LGLLLTTAVAQAQIQNPQSIKSIGSGLSTTPVVTPITTPINAPITAPIPPINATPISSALAQGGGQAGCDTGCGTSACATTACCDCCPDRFLRVFGGWNQVENMDAALGTAAIPAELEFNPGWALGTAIGKYMTPNLRRELEFTYRHSTPDSVQFGGGNFDDDITGNLRAYSVMANLVYELPNVRIGQFQPYVGSGLGLGVIDANFAHGADNYVIDDAAVAYQGFVGFQRDIGARAKLFAEYRMFGTDKVDVAGPLVTTRDNYLAHNILFGIQINR